MTRNFRLIVLGLATALNVAALAAVDSAMLQSRAKIQLADQQPARILVSARRAEEPIVAARSCPAPAVL